MPWNLLGVQVRRLRGKRGTAGGCRVSSAATTYLIHSFVSPKGGIHGAAEQRGGGGGVLVRSTASMASVRLQIYFQC